ncbi:MAG: hypothetical protein LBF63_04950 [Treponema sp.]|jgi:hypothetical protein|nr:hypothetical protein [Treponema sp.]
MKKQKTLGLLVFALFLAVLVIGCKPDPEPDPFDGTWIGSPNENITVRIEASNGSFKVFVSQDGGKTYQEAQRGTYSGTGNTRTLTFTEVYYDSEWVSVASLTDKEKQNMGLPSTPPTITLDGNTFTFDVGDDEIPFKKQ